MLVTSMLNDTEDDVMQENTDMDNSELDSVQQFRNILTNLFPNIFPLLFLFAKVIHSLRNLCPGGTIGVLPVQSKAYK